MTRSSHGNTCVLIIGGHLIHILYMYVHIMFVRHGLLLGKIFRIQLFLAISGTDKPMFVFKTLKKPYAFSVHLVLYLKQ